MIATFGERQDEFQKHTVWRGDHKRSAFNAALEAARHAATRCQRAKYKAAKDAEAAAAREARAAAAARAARGDAGDLDPVASAKRRIAAYKRDQTRRAEAAKRAAARPRPDALPWYDKTRAARLATREAARRRAAAEAADAAERAKKAAVAARVARVDRVATRRRHDRLGRPEKGSYVLVAEPAKHPKSLDWRPPKAGWTPGPFRNAKATSAEHDRLFGAPPPVAKRALKLVRLRAAVEAFSGKKRDGPIAAKSPGWAKVATAFRRKLRSDGAWVARRRTRILAAVEAVRGRLAALGYDARWHKVRDGASSKSNSPRGRLLLDDDVADDVSDVSFSPAKGPPPEKPTLFKRVDSPDKDALSYADDDSLRPAPDSPAPGAREKATHRVDLGPAPRLGDDDDDDDDDALMMSEEDLMMSEDFKLQSSQQSDA